MKEHKVKVLFFFAPEGVGEVAASIKTDAQKSNVKIRRKNKKKMMFINRALRCFNFFLLHVSLK